MNFTQNQLPSKIFFNYFEANPVSPACLQNTPAQVYFKMYSPT